ncbi:MAG: hypothetical protein FJY85_14650, partial [Deltaproteobacteria bacterium]|nr:hypothetical protein [Deltaproteobacteria bacterium]
NVRKFFQIHEGIEACEHGHWSKWRDFRNRTHGRKVEVRILDPFIARLVKALSAIGLTTSSSCDGHGENKAAVTFCGVYNKAWFRVILDDFIKQRGNLECNWRFEDRECIISHPENRILQLLLEIQSVAKFLYCNRESLRGVKCKVVSSIDADPSIRYRFESEDAAENEIYRVFKSEFLKARSGDPA